MRHIVESISLTSLLAMYGAILSSIGLGWSLYRDLHDRACLRITAHMRRVVQCIDGKWYAVTPDLPVQGASEKVFVVLNVTNVGRRPVQWVGWGGKYRNPVDGKDSFVMIPVALPQMLKEGESHTEYGDVLDLAPVKVLFIWDASGKDWYLSRCALSRLKAECDKFLGRHATESPTANDR